MLKQPVLLAKIGAASGLKGEVRVTPMGEPDMLDQYGRLSSEDGRKFKIKRMRAQKNVLIVKFEGVNSRADAELLSGTELYVERAQLPETEDDDEFYLTDLIGLSVLSKDGEAIGKIADVPNFGADDMLEIQPTTGQSYFLPFTKKVVPEIDLERGFVTVSPPVEVSERDEDAKSTP